MIDFVFTREYNRILQVVMIDSRSLSMPLGVDGNIIKELVDLELNKINENVIFYKLENEKGILIGYVLLKIDTDKKIATLLKYQLRPLFRQNNKEIKQKINDFIINGKWKRDILFSN